MTSAPPGTINVRFSRSTLRRSVYSKHKESEGDGEFPFLSLLCVMDPIIVTEGGGFINCFLFK